MRTKIIICLVALSAIFALAQEVDERPMRAALIRWHEFYHVERHKCDTNNPAVGLALTSGLEFKANTRSMQLDYFDRKVCRLFAAITDAPSASNFVWQIDKWTTNALPNHP
jgi:hypothetical protein